MKQDDIVLRQQRLPENQARKILIYLLALLALASCFWLYWAPSSVALLYESTGAKLPLPTDFILNGYAAICLLPIIILLLVLKQYYKLNLIRLRLLIGAFASIITLNALVYYYLYSPCFDCWQIIE